jgi:hypothetical protein
MKMLKPCKPREIQQTSEDEQTNKNQKIDDKVQTKENGNPNQNKQTVEIEQINEN